MALPDLLARWPLREEQSPSTELRLLACSDLDVLLVDETALERPPYWAVIWPAAVALAEWIAAEGRTRLRGRRVLEIGCGAGLTGLMAARWAREVVQTDLYLEACCLARENARRNGIANVRWFVADWQTWPLRARFDVILGTEVTYERIAMGALAAVLEASVAPGGEVWLADNGRPPGLALATTLEERGWEVALHPLRKIEGKLPIFYEMRPPRGS